MINPAIISQGPGEPFQEVDLEVPELGSHDLLVEVQAVSLNPIDTKRRRLAAPGSVLGWDAVGVVRALGPEAAAEGFAPGQEVFYAGQVDRPGSNQRFHAVDARIVGPKPQSLSVEEAAAMPLTSLTAWESLFSKLKLQADSTGTLVVVGAAGGVGSVLVQLAKRLTQVTVVALASRKESAAWLRELGADHVVNYKDEDYVQQVKNLAPEGVDYIFSSRTPRRQEFFLEVLRPFGEIVCIDEADGIDLNAFKAKAITWHWESMFSRPVGGWDVAYQGEVLRKVAAMLDSGELRHTLTKVVQPINAANIGAAHEEIAKGHTVGKIVISGWE